MLKTRELAELLGFSPATIQDWVERGYLNGVAFRIAGRLRFRESEVLAWLEERRIGQAPLTRDEGGVTVLWSINIDGRTMARDPGDTVRKKAQALGRARYELREAIREARAAGLTLAEIAEAAQLTKQRIHQIIREEGQSDAG